jgi:hypothetical protein
MVDHARRIDARLSRQRIFRRDRMRKSLACTATTQGGADTRGGSY